MIKDAPVPVKAFNPMDDKNIQIVTAKPTASPTVTPPDVTTTEEVAENQTAQKANSNALKMISTAASLDVAVWGSCPHLAPTPYTHP